jgi:hypothetical protein
MSSVVIVDIESFPTPLIVVFLHEVLKKQIRSDKALSGCDFPSRKQFAL